jgi:hypothetical protein
MNRSCVSGTELIVGVNVTGETRARRFFNATKITLESSASLALKYFGDSDEEGFADFPSVHFRQIGPPFAGSYVVASPGSRHPTARMNGGEKGLLLSTGRPVRSIEMWRLPGAVLGKMQTNEGVDIRVGEGETLVDNPVFVWATMKFTSRFSPYRHRRTLFRVYRSLFMIGVLQPHP